MAIINHYSSNGSGSIFDSYQNYIYISHLGDGDGVYWRLPSTPDSIQDTMSVTFNETTVLSRSAPIFTYSNSGPRQVQINLDFHRDLMDEINVGNTSATLMTRFEDGEDYLDSLLRNLQAIALPKYNLENKLVEPPIVAMRLSNEVFIKGVVTGAVNVTYVKPVLSNGKYAQARLAIQIYETQPYDATTVEKNGSFRGMTRGMKAGFNLETSEGGL